MFKLSERQIIDLPMWLPIESFEGLYEVNCREGIVRNARTLKVLNPSPESNGYPQVGLWKNGKLKPKKVHRIVALTSFKYYGIPTDGLCVCHLDEERHDSRISNLALGSRQENMNFPKFKQRISVIQKGKCLSEEAKKKLSKRVGAYKDGRLILKFESIMDAHRNDFDGGSICACCKGKLKTHKGYTWKYI